VDELVATGIEALVAPAIVRCRAAEPVVVLVPRLAEVRSVVLCRRLAVAGNGEVVVAEQGTIGNLAV
jgi:predicted phosphoribosyltransferase